MNKANNQITSEINSQITNWLVNNGLSFCELYTEPGKPWAHAYVDDRGVHFPANVGPAKEVFDKVMNFINTEDFEALDEL